MVVEHALYGGVELGGTKIVCAVGEDNGKLHGQHIFPSGNVRKTIEEIGKFFAAQPDIRALGVGTFGPVNLDKNSPTYGTIGNTPKDGWTNVPLKQLLAEKLPIPIIMETDVNCAATGEQYFGAAQGVSDFVYMTFDTGVGGSLVMNKKLEHGRSHLEIGHMRIPHEEFPPGFTGSCPFHGDCLEGISSGDAMRERYGQPAEHISDPEV
jgi:fructokinase